MFGVAAGATRPRRSRFHPLVRRPVIGRSRRRSVVAGVTVTVMAAVGIAGVIASNNAATAAVSASVAVPAVGYLHTSGASVVDSAGVPFTIKAVNWFGLETTNCTPHGLWQISLDAGLDQIASWGFNTIRLPYSNECIEGTHVDSIDYAKNPALAGKTPLQIMDAVVAGAQARGLRVILDRHRPDSNAQSELWYTAQYSEQTWIADWVMLANRYAGNPTVIGADLHNEPHGAACWGCGDVTRDWQAAATRAGNAIQAVQPDWLIIVEGVEAQGNGTYTWWGGGLSDVASKQVTLGVANRVVYSTHDYPSTVYNQSWFSASNYPDNLPPLWDSTFGYIAKQGIAPVFVGEFGTKLATTSDQKWLAALVDYIKTNNLSFGYWSFNPNSGDTGGLVGDDWTTPQTAKLTALAPILTAVPSTPTTPVTTATSTAKPPTTATSTSKPPTTTSKPPTTTSKPPTTATSTSKPPTTATSTSKPPTTTAAPAGAPKVTWTLSSAWNAGYVAQVVVSSTTLRAGWSVSWADPHAKSVVNAWGMTCSLSGGRITCKGADWATTLQPNQPVSVGLQVAGDGIAPTAPVLTIS
jgi:endoglucanase